MSSLPCLRRVRQNFPPTAPIDIRAVVAREFTRLRHRLRPGASIAVGVGSRGITRLAEIVGAVLDELRAAGTRPFVIPAMGSHGGATPEGQTEVLAGYGISEAAMGVPIRASLDVRNIGSTSTGEAVFCSTEALAADGIVLINRIKPHTDFYSPVLGSGLLKMCVVGLGKHRGASAMHLLASRVGHEAAIRSMAEVLLRTAPLVGGLAILEDAFHAPARLVAVAREDLAAEDELLVAARSLMPLLPFDEIDLLIVDRIGKNISGSGMDPNVIHRSVDGYSSSLVRAGRPAPFIRRIFVRDLTPETHGNGIGIGMADVTTTRLVRAMDTRVTGINAMTSLTLQTAKIPIHFDSDREAMERALASLPLADVRDARVVRIADTLSLVEMEISEPLWQGRGDKPGLAALTEPAELRFDPAGNLVQ